MKKAIIIGASSGIGKQLAILLSEQGYELGLLARRISLLDELKNDLKTTVITKPIDMTNIKESIDTFNTLLTEMKDVDLVIYSSGVGFIDETFDLDHELETIGVNVIGLTVIVNLAYEYFKTRKSGHIVGLSSIAATRGSRGGMCYNATKAYVSNYLEGLRQKSYYDKANVTISDIKPGLVDTAMAKGEGLFWVAPVNIAAKQIMNAIHKKKENVIVTRRWRIINRLLKIIPNGLYKRM